MKKALIGLALVVLALVAYLALWPVPVEPVGCTVAPMPGYAGAHAANQRLARLQHVDLKGESGPEHAAIGKHGKLYVSVASGKILRMNPDGSGQQVFAQTGGRVLGFDFDAAGNLVGADALRGLVSIAPDGKVAVLADRVDGDPIRFADAVAVAGNGKVYFSDASTRFGAKEFGGVVEASMLEIIESGASGRVLEYDPASKKTRIVARGFTFANGVALSKDEQSLFVADTGRYRIWKVALQGNAPAKVLIDNLPGYPDNLMRGQDGRIWAGLVKPRNADADKLAGEPAMRKLIMRLPRALWPLPKDYGHVFAFTEDGKIVADLQDPSGAYSETTGVTETTDRLYIQSLHAKTLAWMPKPAP
jgi:sugar lactone lactonase YvrE